MSVLGAAVRRSKQRQADARLLRVNKVPFPALACCMCVCVSVPLSLAFTE